MKKTRIFVILYLEYQFNQFYINFYYFILYQFLFFIYQFLSESISTFFSAIKTFQIKIKYCLSNSELDIKISHFSYLDNFIYSYIQSLSEYFGSFFLLLELHISLPPPYIEQTNLLSFTLHFSFFFLASTVITISFMKNVLYSY